MASSPHENPPAHRLDSDSLCTLPPSHPKRNNFLPACVSSLWHPSRFWSPRVRLSRKPTLSDIIRTIQLLPALDAADLIASRYLGLQVHWFGRFFGLTDQRDILGAYQLSFSQRGWHRSSRGLIYTGIRPGEYPEIERLRRGTRVDLFGKIQDVDAFLGITLALDRAQVLERNLLDKLIGFSERRY